MRISTKRGVLKIVAAVSLTVIFSLGFEAQSSAGPVSITSPAANSSVSATVAFTCSNAASGATANLYINNVYVAGGHSPVSYSWNTTAKANGSYYLVCNGYVNGGENGSVTENVNVLNAAVAGIAVQNGMNGAAIKAIAVNANGTDGATLATATADSGGQFTMNIAPQNGPVRFRAQGGSYISEQNGAAISAPSPLSALLPSLPKSIAGLSINPLTTFVDSLTQGNISKGQVLATALSNATASIEIDYGISANPATVTPLYTKAAVGTDARRLGLILGAIINQDQLACPGDPGGLVAALASDIYDGVFDGKKSGAAVSYCGGELWAIAGNAQSSDALAGLQQLTLSTRGFAFGGTNNALTLDGVTAAQVLADVVRIESGLVRSAPASVNKFAARTPSMNTARAGATAALLANGKVLIAGGSDNEGNSLSSTELYDPVTNTFALPASTPVMNTARVNDTETLLPNGKVLFAGGFDNDENTFSSTELYDPATNKFALKAGTPTMSTARGGATATLLPNGKVLIAGGVGTAGILKSTELYDPATNKFAASTAVMNEGRTYATATLLPNGKVLIAGGQEGFPDQPGTTDLYDPATNTFAPQAATPLMNTAHFGGTATLLPNGKVLIVGGLNVFNDFAGTDLYDPATNTFAASPPAGGGFGGATATLLSNGKVLIAGGSGFAAHGLVGDNDFTQLYDAATNGNVASPGMNTARADATATLLPNGKVLIAGGWFFTELPAAFFGTPLSSTDLYTP